MASYFAVQPFAAPGFHAASVVFSPGACVLRSLVHQWGETEKLLTAASSVHVDTDKGVGCSTRLRDSVAVE